MTPWSLVKFNVCSGRNWGFCCSNMIWLVCGSILFLKVLEQCKGADWLCNSSNNVLKQIVHINYSLVWSSPISLQKNRTRTHVVTDHVTAKDGSFKQDSKISSKINFAVAYISTSWNLWMRSILGHPTSKQKTQMFNENKGQYYGFHKKTWLFFWKETKIIEIYMVNKNWVFFFTKKLRTNLKVYYTCITYPRNQAYQTKWLVKQKRMISIKKTRLPDIWTVYNIRTVANCYPTRRSRLNRWNTDRIVKYRDSFENSFIIKFSHGKSILLMAFTSKNWDFPRLC